MSNPFLKNVNQNKDIKGIKLSFNAIQHLKKLLLNEPKNTVFRVIVKGGGCSGFQYIFDFDNKINNNDFSITQDDVTLVCDINSIKYIDESIIDFVDSLSGRCFTIINPNAKSSCGCGTSFSV